MFARKFLCFFLTFLFAALLLLVNGCTFHLKGKDIEVEGGTTHVLDVESIGFLQTNSSNPRENGIGRFITF